MQIRSIVFVLMLITLIGVESKRFQCYSCGDTTNIDCSGKMDRRTCEQDNQSCVKIIKLNGTISKGCLTVNNKPFHTTTGKCYLDVQKTNYCPCNGDLCNSAVKTINFGFLIMRFSLVLLALFAWVSLSEASRCYVCGVADSPSNCDLAKAGYCEETDQSCVKIEYPSGRIEKGCYSNTLYGNIRSTYCDYDILHRYVCTCNTNLCNGSAKMNTAGVFALLAISFFAFLKHLI
ncbi:hypothetical protein M3Y97_01113800 [Aphelenchoides bicaudatus]|nr:hypothetical protein M3Y97_01113800 [Aphelenchoides bicaudatus]